MNSHMKYSGTNTGLERYSCVFMSREIESTYMSYMYIYNCNFEHFLGSLVIFHVLVRTPNTSQDSLSSLDWNLQFAWIPPHGFLKQKRPGALLPFRPSCFKEEIVYLCVKSFDKVFYCNSHSGLLLYMNWVFIIIFKTF